MLFIFKVSGIALNGLGSVHEFLVRIDRKIANNVGNHHTISKGICACIKYQKTKLTTESV